MRVLLTWLLLSSVAEAQPFVGSPAQQLDLRDLDGKPLATSQLAGRVAIVDFFATWCGPCHLAMAALDAQVRADPRLQLVIVDVGEDPALVRAFFAQRPQMTGTRVLVDPDAAAARRWGARRFPTTFFVDGNGVIRHINRGFGAGYADRVAAWLKQMR